MNVTFRLDEKDYIRFNYWYSRRTLIFVNAIYGIIIVAIAFLPMTNPRYAILSVILPLIILVLLLVYFNASLYFRAKKIWNSDSFLQKEQTYHITSEAVAVMTERSNALIHWHEVYSFAESKDYFYIFMGRNKAYMLPKRFLDDAAVNELLQLAIANLPPKKVRVMR